RRSPNLPPRAVRASRAPAGRDDHCDGRSHPRLNCRAVGGSQCRYAARMRTPFATRAMLVLAAASFALVGCNADSTPAGTAPDGGGAGFDGALPDASGTDGGGGAPGTACGLRYGTAFKYVVGG